MGLRFSDGRNVAPGELSRVKEGLSMPEYSFISIRVAHRRDGAALTRDYRDAIREQAADGWEFVQAISFETHVDPRIDLVFVKKGVSK